MPDGYPPSPKFRYIAPSGLRCRLPMRRTARRGTQPGLDVSGETTGGIHPIVGPDRSGLVPAPKRLADRDPGSSPGLKVNWPRRSEEHTSELQSLMRISYAVCCLKKKN